MKSGRISNLSKKLKVRSLHSIIARHDVLIKQRACNIDILWLSTGYKPSKSITSDGCINSGTEASQDQGTHITVLNKAEINKYGIRGVNPGVGVGVAIPQILEWGGRGGRSGVVKYYYTLYRAEST